MPASIPNFPLTFLEGDHPIPGAHSLEAGQKTLEFVSSLGPDDLLFCLISGGGSALVTTQLEGVSLEDLQALTSTLLACGARIDEINSLRRRLERLKGGGLVKASNGATIVSLILSDVVGNPLEAIASGPTAPDPTSRSDATGVAGEISDCLEKSRFHSRRPGADSGNTQTGRSHLRESPECHCGEQPAGCPGCPGTGRDGGIPSVSSAYRPARRGAPGRL